MVVEFIIEYLSLECFLLYCINIQEDNSLLILLLDVFVVNEVLIGMLEYMKVVMLYGVFFELFDDSQDVFIDVVEVLCSKFLEVDEKVFEFLFYLYVSDQVQFIFQVDFNLVMLFDCIIKDQLSEYFNIIEKIYMEGYINESMQEVIWSNYFNYEGFFNFNEGICCIIYQYFYIFVSNLEVGDYVEFFEIIKFFVIYMGLFGNQQFNQDFKELLMGYVCKFLKIYIDKCGKDYQDIKKFVFVIFFDFEFFIEKEIVNFFKICCKCKKKEEV